MSKIEVDEGYLTDRVGRPVYTLVLTKEMESRISVTHVCSYTVPELQSIANVIIKFLEELHAEN